LSAPCANSGVYGRNRRFRERLFIVALRAESAAASASSGASARFSFPALPFLGRTVGGILEPRDMGEYCLTQNQWQKVQEAEQRYAKCKRVASSRQRRGLSAEWRVVDPAWFAETLIGSYRRSYKVASQFVPHSASPCASQPPPPQQQLPADGDGGASREPPPRPRFFSPRECCRLMGFPEGFVVPGDADSRSGEVGRFYQQVGNAVPPPLVAAVGGAILGALRAQPSLVAAGVEAAVRLAWSASPAAGPVAEAEATNAAMIEELQRVVRDRSALRRVEYNRRDLGRRGDCASSATGDPEDAVDPGGRVTITDKAPAPAD
jgi:hypothetical protein